jgi:acyl carrier protein
MTSEKIRGIWERQLVLPDIKDDDDFFELGGHSLIMQKIQIEIKDEFGIEVPMDELFRFPTIAEISKRIDRASAVQH